MGLEENNISIMWVKQCPKPPSVPPIYGDLGVVYGIVLPTLRKLSYDTKWLPKPWSCPSRGKRPAWQHLVPVQRQIWNNNTNQQQPTTTDNDQKQPTTTAAAAATTTTTTKTTTTTTTTATTTTTTTNNNSNKTSNLKTTKVVDEV